jgi:hypothetical protein
MNNLYHKVAVASVCTALGFVLGASPEAKAATFAPTITFEVGDGDGFKGLSFDGRGDYLGVGSFGYILREVTRDQGEFAEFNISSLSLAPNTVISSAVLQTQIRDFPMTGYGVVNYTQPGTLGIFGYVGNGRYDLSDFEAGVILSSIDISSSSPGDILNFDITPFVNQRVNNGDAFAGFSIRALNLGSVIIGSPGKHPRLIVEIADVAGPVPEPTTIFGSAIGLCLGGWLKRKKSSQQNKTTPQH